MRRHVEEWIKTLRWQLAWVIATMIALLPAALPKDKTINFFILTQQD